MNDLERFFRREIDLGSFPSVSYAIGTIEGGIAHENALGHAVAVPLRIPATVDTIYDCASTTKVLVTTILLLQAIAEKRISLDDEYRGFTYRELLTHTTGLKSWLPLYAFDDPLRAIEEHGYEHPRGAVVTYSDLNFVLLYFALQEIFGDYDAAARTRIFEPLGLRDARLRTALEVRPRVAATEWGQRFEYGMCATRSIVFTGFRQGLMWGEVNDGNSFHHGGTLGNAGLFATAREVFRIAQAFAGGELVSRELAEEATRTFREDRALGWAKSGPGLGEESYGHMGFTGTSVWIEQERIYVLLTNRVHPCAAPIAMHRIRGEFHRLSSSMLSSSTRSS